MCEDGWLAGRDGNFDGFAEDAPAPPAPCLDGEDHQISSFQGTAHDGDNSWNHFRKFTRPIVRCHQARSGHALEFRFVHFTFLRRTRDERTTWNRFQHIAPGHPPWFWDTELEMLQGTRFCTWSSKTQIGKIKHGAHLPPTFLASTSKRQRWLLKSSGYDFFFVCGHSGLCGPSRSASGLAVPRALWDECRVHSTLGSIPEREAVGKWPRCGGHRFLMPASGALGDDGTVLEIVWLASRDTGEGW